MNRSSEPGWRLLVRDDPTGRRGVWARLSREKLDLCSGREGDDYCLVLQVGQVLTGATLDQLHDLLEAGREPSIDYYAAAEDVDVRRAPLCRRPLMDRETARRIRAARVDENFTWRAISREFADLENQHTGELLCREAAQVLGEDSDRPPWNEPWLAGAPC